jgi:NAD(P)-dependent dehydrogenase (short-subunit alcohol dehydrogenase family)
LEFQILELNGFRKPYCQIKWIFPSMMAPINSLIFFMTHSQAKMAPDIGRPRVRALIVGASGGLGSALVAQLRADTWYTQIVAWSRSSTVVTGEKILANHVDLRDEMTIAAAARSLGEVDLAIVATGLRHDGNLKPEKSWSSLDPSVMMRAFEINTVGPALIAKHVLPLLPRDRRAVFVALSARVGSIGDNRLGGWHSYASPVRRA